MEKMKAMRSQEDKNKEIIEVISNTEIPLEDRWNIYKKSIETNYFINRGNWYFIPQTLIELEDFSLYDDAYVDRYETYDYKVFFDEEFLHKAENNELTDLSDIEKYNDIRSEILANGHSSWKNDW